MEDAYPRRRLTITPAVELLVLAITVAVAITSYLLLAGANDPRRLIPPPFVALLLVANLVPGILLLMLVGRRIAKKRAASSPVGGEGRLHVRLVALFSTVAAVPILLVTIVASLLFQYGVQFWYSDQARGMINNATGLATTAYQMSIDRWTSEASAMASDLAATLEQEAPDSPEFQLYFARQVYQRNLNEAAIFYAGGRGGIRSIALVNPYDRDLSQVIDQRKIDALKRGDPFVVTDTGQRIQVVTRLPGMDEAYLYAGRLSDMRFMSEQSTRARDVLRDYRALIARARSLQLKFNAALLAISFVIVGIAVWIALAVADRLVRPVGQLVDAARRVTAGDLSARVPDPRSRDEVGTLANAFNQMTRRLQEQNTELLTANDQLESRRALIEAVMAGVSAGVIATTEDRVVSIANASAGALLDADSAGLVGRALADVAPELDALVREGTREAVIQIHGWRRGTRTLAVRYAEIDRGPILTFDDVTEQLSDQRRAAWADVARRIAHEIKNPLTPIQLAAERLQRRYGARVEASDDGTFGRLTETIVRQVGDLRRMVDEFSSFARMPKPVFRQEPLLDTAREVLFLHEVAHPAIHFRLEHEDPAPLLVCDRRQIGQALTNIVKNAVEAIEGRGRLPDGEAGEVVLTLSAPQPGEVVLTVADNGIGLPEARDRIVEPYMTTRARGTGLGLAIVKKIVEEHGGTIAFADRPGGGTIVTIIFDAARLAARDTGVPATEPAGEGQLAALIQNRT
ncbi:sensor histidine kinase [Sphingomonas metalli]|nr:ATP-binding protein [Sphingomonas metalli]